MGTMAVLLLGFEIEGTGGEDGGNAGNDEDDGKVKVDVPERGVMGVGVVGSNQEGKQMRIRNKIKRRERLEDVVWGFSCGKKGERGVRGKWLVKRNYDLRSPRSISGGCHVLYRKGYWQLVVH